MNDSKKGSTAQVVIITVIATLVVVGILWIVFKSATVPTQTTSLAVSQSPQSTSSVNQNLFDESQNDSNCKDIAIHAVSVDNQEYVGKKTFSLMESTYNNSLNNCYYEIEENADDNSYYALNLMVAPDDSFIASCIYNTDGVEICSGLNSATIDETQFENLVTQYLGN